MRVEMTLVMMTTMDTVEATSALSALVAMFKEKGFSISASNIAVTSDGDVSPNRKRFKAPSGVNPEYRDQIAVLNDVVAWARSENDIRSISQLCRLVGMNPVQFSHYKGGRQRFTPPKIRQLTQALDGLAPTEIIEKLLALLPNGLPTQESQASS